MTMRRVRDRSPSGPDAEPPKSKELHGQVTKRLMWSGSKRLARRAPAFRRNAVRRVKEQDEELAVADDKPFGRCAGMTTYVHFSWINELL